MLKHVKGIPMATAIIAAVMSAMAFMTIPANAADAYVQDNANVISQSTETRINDINRQLKANHLPELYVYTASNPDGDVSTANDSIIRNNTSNPDYSIVLFLYTQARSKGLRYGGNVPQSITGYLTDGNVYNAAALDRLKSGDFDGGMKTAASNTVNYINAAAKSGTRSASNQYAPNASKPIDSKPVIIGLLGIIGFIAAGIGTLMGFASIGRSKSNRRAVALVKQHANDVRFGSPAYNNGYTDDSWANAIIRDMNDSGELAGITTDKSAVKACYDAGRRVYMATGYGNDIQGCEYYDASLNYKDAIRDSEIEMDSFDLQSVVDRVNKAHKAEMADEKRLNDAIENGMNMMDARTSLNDADRAAIRLAIDNSRKSLLLGGKTGERHVATTLLNNVMEDAVVDSKSKAYASRFLWDNSSKKEPFFDDKAFIRKMMQYGSDNAGSVLAGEMGFMDDHARNALASLNEQAIAERKRREEECRRHSNASSALVAGVAGGIAGYALGSSSHDDDNGFGGFDSGFGGGFDSGFGNDSGGFDSGFGGDSGGFDSGF